MNKNLKYLSSSQINKQQWDALVSASNNSLVYNFSWYLDQFSEWDAIILGEYDGAIALPRKKKMALSFLYQPSFIQKCQWFGQELTTETQVHLSKLLKSKFSLLEINTDSTLGFNYVERVNLILPLKNYSEIRANYSKTLRKNITKNHSKLEVVNSIEGVQDTINLYKAAYGTLNAQLIDKDYINLINLVSERSENFFHLQVKHENELVAGLLFAVGKNRLHYILGAPTPQGRKLNALSVALDYLIYKHTENNMILDFEGSSIPPVKKFYESFGAQNEPFYTIKYGNSLLKALRSVYNKWLKV